VLSGEPGIGKTSLLREMGLRAEVQGFASVYGRCLPQHLPYQDLIWQRIWRGLSEKHSYQGTVSAAPAALHPCAFAKLNPHDFVGDFEASAIACVHGGAIRRGTPSGSKPTQEPNGARFGSARTAPSNCRARAQPNSSALLPPLGSPALDLAFMAVAKLARKPADRPAADGLALAP
jgi:hypothetical protein